MWKACIYPKHSFICNAGKGSEIGDYLTTHPKVNAISFTGELRVFCGICACSQAQMCTSTCCLPSPSLQDTLYATVMPWHA